MYEKANPGSVDRVLKACAKVITLSEESSHISARHVARRPRRTRPQRDPDGSRIGEGQHGRLRRRRLAPQGHRRAAGRLARGRPTTIPEWRPRSSPARSATADLVDESLPAGTSSSAASATTSSWTCSRARPWRCCPRATRRCRCSSSKRWRVAACVISTTVGGIPALLDDDHGELVPPDDADSARRGARTRARRREASGSPGDAWVRSIPHRLLGRGRLSARGADLARRRTRCDHPTGERRQPPREREPNEALRDRLRIPGRRARGRHGVDRPRGRRHRRRPAQDRRPRRRARRRSSSPASRRLLTDGVASGRLRFTTDMSEAAGADGALRRRRHAAAEGRLRRRPHVRQCRRRRARCPTSRPATSSPASRRCRSAPRRRSPPRVEATGATLVWNPEFLREGWAVQDTIDPDRLVAGVPSAHGRAERRGERAADVLREVYHPAVATDTPFIVTDYATAELVKVAANAFLATKISFINAMAEIAEVTGADVTQLADAIGHDARIGRRFLGAGIGFGGGCLPKDIRAFSARAEELGRGESVAFLREVDAINLRRRDRAVAARRRRPRRRRVREERSPCSARPSSPTATTSATPPPSTSPCGCTGSAPTSSSPTPRRSRTRRRMHPQLTYVEDRDEALARRRRRRRRDRVGRVPARPRPRARRDARDRAAIVVDGRNCLDAAAWRAAGLDLLRHGPPLTAGPPRARPASHVRRRSRPRTGAP